MPSPKVLVGGIEHGNTVQKPEWLRSASRSTSLVNGTIDMSIKELRGQILGPPPPFPLRGQCGYLPQIQLG
jgi:hypothetical protein